MARPEKDSLSAELTIKSEWCKGCGICVAFCPREALFLDRDGKAAKIIDKCLYCGICATFCPDFAIALIKRRTPLNAGDEAGFNAGQ